MAAGVHCGKEVLMGTINRAWHEANRMPKNPTPAQRAAWHYAHAVNCTCREITPTIAALLKEEGYEVPAAHRIETRIK